MSNVVGIGKSFIGMIIRLNYYYISNHDKYTVYMLIFHDQLMCALTQCRVLLTI